MLSYNSTELHVRYRKEYRARNPGPYASEATTRLTLFILVEPTLFCVSVVVDVPPFVPVDFVVVNVLR